MPTSKRSSQIAASVREVEALREAGDFQSVAALAVPLLHDLVARHAHLEARLLKLLRHRFGHSSEKISREQLSLLLAEAAAAPDETTGTPGESDSPESGPADSASPQGDLPKPDPAPAGRKKGHGRRPLPEHLPRRIVTEEPPDEARVCCGCGAAKTCIGHEDSETLEYVPAVLEVIVHRRTKYACRRCEDGVVIGPVADKVIEQGRPGPGLLSYVVVGKYQDHLPLHRQSQMLARLGVDLHRSTLTDWVAEAARVLSPLAEAIRREVLEAHVLGTDDTGLAVLDEDHPKGSKRGHLWIYTGDGRWSAFVYTPDWRADGPRSFLAARRGWVVCDGYAGYEALFTGPDATAVQVACWAHGRRGLVEALVAGATRAVLGVDLIRQLYAIEAAATAEGVSVEERLRRRVEHSTPIVHDLGRWCAETLNREPPKSALAKAVRYMVSRWSALTRFLEDGRLPLDNNASERGLRVVALGRKNWLFAGSDAGAERAAVMYTLLGTCRLNDVEPWAYLKDVFGKIASGFPASRIGELLPPAWKAAHTPASPPIDAAHEPAATAA